MSLSLHHSSTLVLLSGLTFWFIVLQTLYTWFQFDRRLSRIPSVGVPRSPFGFYIGAWNFIKAGRELTQEGYLKYPGQAFKVVLGNRWLVILNGRALIQELQKAPDDELSFIEAATALVHMGLTMGQEHLNDLYQISVIRTSLTRNIAVCFPTIHSEVVAAFEDLVPANASEWASVPAMNTVLKIVSRTYNRVFIGLKCRDPELIAVMGKFAVNVVKDATVLHVTPAFLRPLFMHLFGNLEPATKNAMKLVGPIIQYRLEMNNKYGRDWPESDRPNDLITWLIDEAGDRPDRLTVRNLTRKLLVVNFGALHTTTQAFLHALYNLAANPEYTAALREEIESVINVEGWTKAGMGKLTKVDSFLKETNRLASFSVSALRVALKDFTFCDGATVPVGTLIGVALHAEHYSNINYPNASEFDPFRFSRLREEAGDGTKHLMVAPTHDYLVFGIGRHACPGRFIAVNEMKLMLAHVIMTYDVKIRDGVRPPDEWTAMIMSANSKAEVMFRKRA
ncbi:cytochrome P450 [Mycena rebaudengoi]|nr:cytochrome P450 [Mycena rebaudengoi]